MIGRLLRLFKPAAIGIAPASVRDAAQLSQLHRASFHRGWGQGEFESLLASANVLAHRLLAGRKPIGFVISRMAADESEILSVAISPAMRGRGLSRTLLRDHLGYLSGHGVKHVFLEVEENNAPAVRLYQRLGFRTVGKREQYYRDASGAKLNALIMQRDLS